MYDTVATELLNGRMLELSKSYVTLQIYTDNGFITTSTEYKCPFCNTKEKTDVHTTKQEGEKVVVEVECRACKQNLISEKLSKNEL